MTTQVGSKHPRAKLDESDVVNIKALLDLREYHRREAAKLTVQEIADKFGVHEATVRRIQTGRNWSHV